MDREAAALFVFHLSKKSNANAIAIAIAIAIARPTSVAVSLEYVYPAAGRVRPLPAADDTCAAADAPLHVAGSDWVRMDLRYTGD